MIPVIHILAQRPHSKEIQGFFDGLHTALRPNTVGPPAIMLILGFVAGIVALLLVLAVLKTRRAANPSDSADGRPMRLFSQAMRRLGIGWPDRLLMRVIVRRARLPHPTVLLLSPPMLERHAVRWADSLSITPLRNHVRGRLKAISQKAFN